jgi:16S rRNA G966 N2-methylase RsmD
MSEIEKYKGFRNELALAETLEEIKFIENKAAAVAEFARKNHIGLKQQNEWGKFRVNIEEKKGAWLDEKFPAFTGKKIKGSTHSTLKSEGITKFESQQARKIYHHPEDVQMIIEQIEKSGRKVITPSLVNRELKKKNIKDIRKALSVQGELKELPFDFRLGDFETVLKDIPDGSIDCIITDPPYPYEFIDCWSKLSRFAKRVLKPNGFCITYSGQMYLPNVIQRMSENLDYYWTFCLYHTGTTQIVNGTNLICRWKPVLIFQNGKRKLSNTFQDYFTSDKPEKGEHEWQQSKSGVRYLIEMFTNPNEIICDPFAGSGTTLVEAREMGRRIIGAEIEEDVYNIAKSKF